MNREKKDNKKACDQWRRTTLERWLLSTCLVLLIATVSFIVAIAIINSIYAHRRVRAICSSPQCQREAGIILKDMDSSINPCHHFYKFACGSFMMDERSKEETFSNYMSSFEFLLRYSKELLESTTGNDELDFVRKLKKFYRACTKSPSDTTEIIRALLTKSHIKVWPFPIYDTYADELPTLEEVLSIILSTTDGRKMALFSLSRNGSRLTLDKGERFVDETMLVNRTDGELARNRKRYRRLLALTLFQVRKPSYNLEDEVDDIIDFQTSLAQISSYTTKDNETTYYLSDLDSICPQIKWSLLVRNIYKKYGRSEMIDAINETIISIKSMNYFEDLCQLIEETGSGIVHNFLVWDFLQETLFWLDSSFHRRLKDIDPTNQKFQDSTSKHHSIRWKYCINTIRRNKIFRPGLDYLVAEDMNLKGYTKEISRYVEGVREAVHASMGSGHQPDDHVWENLTKFPIDIGSLRSPQKIKSLNRQFSKVVVTENYVENWTRSRNLLFSANFLGNDFLLQNTAQIQPVFGFGTDDSELAVPLEIFVPPVFTPEVPGYINYGGFGFLLARRMAHIDFRNKERNRAIRSKAECLSRRYAEALRNNDGSVVEYIGLFQDMVTENIGIKYAFSAYKRYIDKRGEDPNLPGLDYTNRQMFFIKYAQLQCEIVRNRDEICEHIAANYRVDGILKEFPAFAEEFGCAVGDNMNPIDRCLT